MLGWLILYFEIKIFEGLDLMYFLWIFINKLIFKKFWDCLWGFILMSKLDMYVYIFNWKGGGVRVIILEMGDCLI